MAKQAVKSGGKTKKAGAPKTTEANTGAGPALAAHSKDAAGAKAAATGKSTGVKPAGKAGPAKGAASKTAAKKPSAKAGAASPSIVSRVTGGLKKVASAAGSLVGHKPKS